MAVVSDVSVRTGAERAGKIGARFVPADVGMEADIKALVGNVLEQEGRIDLFGSNAGLAPPVGRLHRGSPSPTPLAASACPRYARRAC
jgi:NAD(P)-dependent dehydrogenase (short-subunit alcohol dehydrogenase family)